MRRESDLHRPSSLPPCHPASFAGQPGILVSDLVKDYGQGPVLDGLSFALPAGETLAVIGSSGCGKSTLLYLLAGLDRPGSGSVCLNRSGGTRKVAFILQDFGLFPWKTVDENIALPLRLAGKPRGERRKAVSAMLEELHLEGLGARYPAQLSGGQRQRVAVGRALITHPDVLLMDEPFSSLDAITREQMQNLVLRLWKKRNLTSVLVTHSVNEAAFLGRYVMVLAGRPARKTLWLENPWFGDPDCRGREGYFALTRQIYDALDTDEEDACLS